MTRQREIPSVQYRSVNQINMVFPDVPGVPKIRVLGAARINDAYGNVAGVGGGGPLPMFEVQMGGTYLSPTIRARKLPAVDESNRGLTRMVFDPDDFATPAAGAGTTYLPTDDQTLFIRISLWNSGTGAWNPPGPIMAIPPYDFFTTKEPVFTVTGNAPNLGIAAWPGALPDFLPPTVMNFLVPAYSTSISLENLGDSGEAPIFASFHPGIPPTVVKADRDFGLTGSGVPEFFVASPNANPLFTVRIAVVNSA